MQKLFKTMSWFLIAFIFVSCFRRSKSATDVRQSVYKTKIPSRPLNWYFNFDSAISTLVEEENTLDCNFLIRTKIKHFGVVCYSFTRPLSKSTPNLYKPSDQNNIMDKMGTHVYTFLQQHNYPDLSLMDRSFKNVSVKKYCEIVVVIWYTHYCRFLQAFF